MRSSAFATSYIVRADQTDGRFAVSERTDPPAPDRGLALYEGGRIVNTVGMIGHGPWVVAGFERAHTSDRFALARAPSGRVELSRD